MSLPLLSLLGWSIVPDFLTRHLISFLHRSGILPAPKTPATFRKHYAFTFAFVVLSYLLYTLIDSARSMPPNFYQILGVRPDVDDQGLRAAFRQFAKRNHPDRPGVGRDGEQLFIMVRDVYEALKDPVVRFAYDRFGPDVLMWSKTCSTTRDYIRQGLLQSSGYHLFVGAALIFWSLVGSSPNSGSGPSNPIAFWRHLLYATLFVAELSLILSPSPPLASSHAPPPPGLATTYTTDTPLHALFPYRIIHQHILFLHQLFIFLSVALSRVVPILIAGFVPAPPSDALNQELIKNVAGLAMIADRETSVAVHTLMHTIAAPSQEPHEDTSSLARPRPFKVPETLLNLISSPSLPSTQSQVPDDPFPALIKEMESLVIEANIKKEDGPLRSAWEAAVRRGQSTGWSPQPERTGDLGRSPSSKRTRGRSASL